MSHPIIIPSMQPTGTHEKFPDGQSELLRPSLLEAGQHRRRVARRAREVLRQVVGHGPSARVHARHHKQTPAHCYRCLEHSFLSRINTNQKRIMYLIKNTQTIITFYCGSMTVHYKL